MLRNELKKNTNAKLKVRLGSGFSTVSEKRFCSRHKKNYKVHFRKLNHAAVINVKVRECFFNHPKLLFNQKKVVLSNKIFSNELTKSTIVIIFNMKH